MEPRQLAFTVDVEDGISLAMRDAFGVNSDQTDRVVSNSRKILQLLEKHQVKGTFFVLGKVAEDFPYLIREIASAGHEIGIHGYNHIQFFRMSPNQARQELESAKKLVEDIISSEVKGHRAPAFSINEGTSWALDVIAESGFTYDSSIMPIEGLRYGWPGYPKEIRKLRTHNGQTLIEAPLSTLNIFGIEMPFSGGGYFRLFPFLFTKRAFASVYKHRPVILYMHPYELDTERYPDYFFEQLNKAPYLKKQKLKSNWINRGSFYSKLERLLERYAFDTLWNVIQESNYQNIPEHKLTA